ncbi:ankyrin repeat domain-containing protein 65-like [Leptopilina heterotoma]|uniref:ankyrin repeat domain-containing protein 65-like n=1 Tax=Leptopilina heterotoma TaxID=63436 RepID=UPI001CA82018|nr:ankyrin repeat domain-containing protein 65-like [Leptopilina heterotoma]
MDSSNNYDDTSDYNELFLAVHNGELNLIHSLLKKHSATETINGRTLLHVAAARGHAEIAKTLLGNGATIGVQDIKGKTPLDVSLAKGNVQIPIVKGDVKIDIKNDVKKDVKYDVKFDVKKDVKKDVIFWDKK